VIIHVIYCRGCRNAWTDTEPSAGETVPPLDPLALEFDCECTCTDLDAAEYEDWVTDPEPSSVPADAWAVAAGRVMRAVSGFLGDLPGDP
jgi:hypothetical protein